MKKEEIKACLKECTNLVELVGKANQLKSNGEKESVVNRVVTELRKEMLIAKKDVPSIPREAIPDIDETPTGRIPFGINNLSEPTIIYGNGAVLM